MANPDAPNHQSDRRRVCHAFAGTEGGRWVHEQLRALRQDHACEVTALLGGTEGTAVDQCRAKDIPFKPFDFDLSSPSKIITAAFRVLRLALWLRRERFDVVQSHVMSSTIFVRPAAWLADIPVRLTMVTGPYYMQAPAFRKLELDTVWMETGIVPSCDLTAQLYRAEAAAPQIAEVLYYGPDASDWDPAQAEPAGLREEFGLDADALLIGCVAIFYPKCDANDFYPPETHGRHIKGQDDLIRALPAVLEQFPKARLVFFGKGWSEAGDQAEAEIRQLAVDLGLQDKVIFAGYRDNIQGIYRELDVSVQAAHNDNLGGTVESLLMEAPTVATRVGGMVDAVIDRETGLLAEPGDPASLAEAMCAMLADPDQARQWAQAGRRRMLDRFCLDATAAGLSRLYDRQLAQAPRRRRLSRSIARVFVGAAHFLPIFVRTVAKHHSMKRYANLLRSRLARIARAALPTPGN